MREEATTKTPTFAPIDEDVLWRLSVLIRDSMGLDFTGDNRADLERGVRQAARDFGFQGEGAARRCAENLVDGPIATSQIEILARYLTIGETYFFRDPALFEALRTHIWPALLQLRRESGSRELRIWSAACCTGEEPYSLAMQLHTLLPQILPDWQAWKITVLATDLNPAFLKKAESGLYGAWSFRSASRDEQKRFFDVTSDGLFQLKPEIRRLVQFARLNLVSDAYPSLLNGTAGQDIIFCRNVLMYFSVEQARTVASHLIRCLNEGGYLVPAASEASATLFAPLKTVSLPGVILYQKTNAPHLESRLTTRIETREPIITKPYSPPEVLPKTPLTPPAPKTIIKATAQGVNQGVPQTNNKLAEGWYEKAHAAAGLGCLDEALTFCDRAIEENKMTARYYYLRASILLEKLTGDEKDKDFAEREAEAALRRALYLEPDFALAHFVLGNLERRRARTEAARRSWQNALRVLQKLPPDAPLDGGDELTAGHAASMIERALLTLANSE